MGHFHRTGVARAVVDFLIHPGQFGPVYRSVADRCRRSIVFLRSLICGAVYPREADVRTLNSVAVDHVLEIFDSTINNHRSDEDECDA